MSAVDRQARFRWASKTRPTLLWMRELTAQARFRWASKTRPTLLMLLCVALLTGCQQPSHTAPSELDRYCDEAVARLDRPPNSNQDPPQLALVSHQVEELPVPAETTPQTKLTLSDVVQSVYESYPLLEVALRERDIAEGKELAAWGEFDTGLKAYSVADPMGYYKRYRNVVKLDQPLFSGGSVFGGYKLGRGSFHPAWYDDQTNRGGEFSAGIGVPLLKDRLIDKRRGGVSQAALARQAVEPAVQAQLLDFVREASQAYWYWVATGQASLAQKELLRLAQDRVEQIEQRVQSGDLERIARIDNQRLIASREAKVIDAERKLQVAAIKLSLFMRTSDGQPLLPDVGLLPDAFPTPRRPTSNSCNRTSRPPWRPGRSWSNWICSRSKRASSWLKRKTCSCPNSMPSWKRPKTSVRRRSRKTRRGPSNSKREFTAKCRCSAGKPRARSPRPAARWPSCAPNASSSPTRSRPRSRTPSRH